jgi:lipopolysaccharide biosynthesis protein
VLIPNAMLKPIAFYLPQYHPIPENDEWWGQGFTEWRNVAKAVPNVPGHHQPHVPADLGFYDLRLLEVQKKQIELAKTYGLYGFCYYYYWFNGRRILERPLDQLAAHPELDFPFCVCWANENWTRTWDGLEKHVLLPQNHGPEDDVAFFNSVLPLMKDPRYIRVDGKPLLMIYRVDLFPDARATAERWRKLAAEAGLPGLHLVAVQFWGINDPRPFGFDAAVEFPPHQYIGPENRPDHFPTITNPQFQGSLVDYVKVATQSVKRPRPDYRLYRGIVPSWDNTARRQDSPVTMINSSPHEYHAWLRQLADEVRRTQPPEHQLLFINAWNEWGEGCHLEPDLKHGRGYLEATNDVVQGNRGVHALVEEVRQAPADDRTAAAELIQALEARDRSLWALRELVRQKNSQVDQLHAELEKAKEGPLWRLAKQKLARFEVLREGVNRFPALKNKVKGVLNRRA